MPRSAEAVDGRVGRLLRSRLAICDACLDLIAEGVLRPTADQIAERAGLSRRSIFHHFGDLAELYRAVAEVGMQRCAPLLKEVPKHGPLTERVERLTEVRSTFLEATSPFARALTAQVLIGPGRTEAWQISRDSLRQQSLEVEAIFERELAPMSPARRAETVEALSAAMNAPVWDYLRHGRGLSMARARAVMALSVGAVLRDATSAPR